MGIAPHRPHVQHGGRRPDVGTGPGELTAQRAWMEEHGVRGDVGQFSAPAARRSIVLSSW